MENEKIMLWNDVAPYTEDSPEQEQPSLKAFPAEGSHGAVVVCPGGAYCCKAEHEGDPICRMLNEAGISAYTLDYRVKPCNKFAPLSDAQRAIRVLRSLGYEKVAILGFSAGGNLVCSAGTLYDLKAYEPTDEIDKLSARPDAFVPCYAVVSLGEFTHVCSRESLLGKEKDDRKLWKLFSAEENITENTPPCFIWHTVEDNCVPVQNAINLARALADHHIPFEMHLYPHGWHGIGLAQDWREAKEWPAECQRWLTDLGFGK